MIFRIYCGVPLVFPDHSSDFLLDVVFYDFTHNVSGHHEFFMAFGCTLTNYGFLDLFVQEIFQERVVSRREEEFTRLRREREERLSQILQSRRQEREKLRKLKFYLSSEEERQRKLQEQEEARKLEGKFF